MTLEGASIGLPGINTWTNKEMIGHPQENPGDGMRHTPCPQQLTNINIPIPSMYGIIYADFLWLNVGKYTIHGSYGMG